MSQEETLIAPQPNIAALKKYAKTEVPTEVAKLRTFTVKALNNALIELDKAHKAKIKMEPKDSEGELSRTEEGTGETVDVTEEIFKHIDSVLSADPTLEAEISPEYRPDFLHKLNAKQLDWLYARLPEGVKVGTLTEALVAEALYNYFIQRSKTKENNETYKSIIDLLPRVSEQLEVLKNERLLIEVKLWVDRFASLNDEKQSFEQKALSAVDRWLRGDVSVFAGNWQKDKNSYPYVIFLMQHFPSVAQKISNNKIFSAENILTNGHPHTLYNRLLNSSGYINNYTSDLYRELSDSDAVWLENLPCLPLSAINFNNNEPVAESIARAKLTAFINSNVFVKNPVEQSKAAWQHIARSPTLTRIILESKQTGFWSLLVEKFSSKNLVNQLSAQDILTVFRNQEAPVGVRKAIQNTVKNRSWWERALNAIGIQVGLSGKFTELERLEIESAKIVESKQQHHKDFNNQLNSLIEDRSFLMKLGSTQKQITKDKMAKVLKELPEAAAAVAAVAQQKNKTKAAMSAVLKELPEAVGKRKPDDVTSTKGDQQSSTRSTPNHDTDSEINLGSKHSGEGNTTTEFDLSSVGSVEHGIEERTTFAAVDAADDVIT
ncbi:MAG: hypothetical protein ABSF18_07795, partial [Gammaproteobacteria bacterium]